MYESFDGRLRKNAVCELGNGRGKKSSLCRPVGLDEARGSFGQLLFCMFTRRGNVRLSVAVVMKEFGEATFHAMDERNFRQKTKENPSVSNALAIEAKGQFS